MQHYDIKINQPNKTRKKQSNIGITNVKIHGFGQALDEISSDYSTFQRARTVIEELNI